MITNYHFGNLRLKLLTLLFFLLTSTLAYSQTTESINTDRPGQSTNPHTVGVGVSQLQYGIDYYDPNLINTTILIRYGFAEKFEFNAGYSSAYEYLTNQQKNYYKLKSNYQLGTTHINIGARYNLMQSDNYMPGIGIQATMFLDVGGYYRTTGSYYHFILSVDQKLVKDLRIGGNIISDHDLDLHHNLILYTTYLSFSHKDFGFLLEMYGDFLRDIETQWDVGISYQYRKDMLIDANYGQRSYTSFYGEETFWNAEIGLTYRIPKN